MAFKILKKINTAALVGLLTMSSAFNAYAGPGELPKIPIYNTNLGVEPNIYFTIDDSGSMAWELSFKEGATGFPTDQGRPRVNGHLRSYMIPGWRSGNSLMPAYSFDVLNDNHQYWIFYTPDGNSIYYDYSLDYFPWSGKDEDDNNMYADANPTSVKEKPNDAANDKDNLDITKNVSKRYIPLYCTWDDDKTDNGLSSDDDHTCYEIKSGNTFPSGRSYEDELQNFANWLQYYRKREYAAKQAIGQVMNATNEARMGLSFINSDTKRNLKTMTDDDNKRDLLETYYADGSSGTTPLRAALHSTGQMFMGNNAILPEEQGGECQQNFNILMTDGYWNGNAPSGFGNEDGDADTIFDGDADNSVDQGNYADSASSTLADIAMYYYENDLRDDLADRVPVSPGVDLAPHQHLVNYTIAFGLTGTLDPSIAPTDDDFPGWPTVEEDTDTTLDDLWHAAYNSRGLYLSADNSQVLLDSLLTAVADITDRETTAAAAAVTSAKLTTDTIVFLAEYNSSQWKGDLGAFKIVNFDTGELAELPEWSAAEKLAARENPVATRNILTNSTDGVPFRWSSLTDDMKNDLRTTCLPEDEVIEPAEGSCIKQLDKYYCPVSRNYYRNDCSRDDRLRTGERGNRKYYCYDPNISDVNVATPANCSVDDTDDRAMARLDYLRGDDSNEGSGYDFRERLDTKRENRLLLGDIVNSGPVFVGPPTLRIPDAAPFPTGANAYSQFKKANENRTGVVYVGANDGKFHAFKETDGEELLAYIPSYLFSTQDQKGLHYLTEKHYKHMFYNDLTATVADVFANTGAASGWRTVLIGGQRAGGRGYFALDVTNPTSFAEANAADTVMWEFSSDDDADLGFTYSRPQIGMLNDGTWVTIFGNGYNSTGDGLAKLFIVKLEGGTDGVWTLGTDYVKITAGSTGSLLDPNGLATPALADIDGNGTIDRAYAGDLNGDLWAFDLSGNFGTGALAYSSPLFTTENNRPITTRPILSFHPTEPTVAGSNEPNLMVFFGTGQYLVANDNATTDLQYFYGVWDKGVDSLTNGNLVEQTFRDGFGANRVLTNNAVDYQLTDYGWKIGLNISKERSVTNPAVRGNVVLFNSTIPTTGPCSAGGVGYRFAVDLATGGSPEEPVLDIDKDGVVDSEDTVSDDGDVPAADFLTSLPTDNTFTEKVGYTGRDPFAIQELNTPQLGRFSWQELLQ